MLILQLGDVYIKTKVDINRLKVVLVERKWISKWLVEQFHKDLATVSNGVLTLLNCHWKH
jgi:hypothetical protein